MFDSSWTLYKQFDPSYPRMFYTKHAFWKAFKVIFYKQDITFLTTWHSECLDHPKQKIGHNIHGLVSWTNPIISRCPSRLAIAINQTRPMRHVVTYGSYKSNIRFAIVERKKNNEKEMNHFSWLTVKVLIKWLNLSFHISLSF